MEVPEIPEQGIQPSTIFNEKNYKRKGFIKSQDNITIAGALATQECVIDDLESDFVQIFFKNILVLSGSIQTKNGSYAIDNYTEAAKARIGAEDRKAKVMIDGGTQ